MRRTTITILGFCKCYNYMYTLSSGNGTTATKVELSAKP